MKWKYTHAHMRATGDGSRRFGAHKIGVERESCQETNTNDQRLNWFSARRALRMMLLRLPALNDGCCASVSVCVCVSTNTAIIVSTSCSSFLVATNFCFCLFFFSRFFRSIKSNIKYAFSFPLRHHHNWTADSILLVTIDDGHLVKWRNQYRDLCRFYVFSDFRIWWRGKETRKHDRASAINRLPTTCRTERDKFSMRRRTTKS